MSPVSIRILVEATPKKVYVSALDWPGLARGGRDEGEAVEALLAAIPRYAEVAADAGHEMGSEGAHVDVIELLEGNATTAFGAPAVIAEADRAPLLEADAARLAELVAASWRAFDRIAAAAPEALRKGPRGGGRDRTKIVGHVNEADDYYARELGLVKRPKEIAALRAVMLEVLRLPSDGSPLAGRRWTTRYAARRIAWHALDHAWEIEDRTER